MKWKKKVKCHNYGIYCMNNAVSQCNTGNGIKWYCLNCQAEEIEDLDDIESDESLQVCLEELEIQSKEKA